MSEKLLAPQLKAAFLAGVRVGKAASINVTGHGSMFRYNGVLHSTPEKAADAYVADATGDQIGWTQWYANARADMESRYNRRDVPTDLYQKQFALGATPEHAAYEINVSYLYRGGK